MAEGGILPWPGDCASGQNGFSLVARSQLSSRFCFVFPTADFPLMKIGLVRRGFSPTGGAESYLRRLAAALEAAGHSCALFGGSAWPRAEWPAHRNFFRVPGNGPRRFADALAALEPRNRCDLLFSLERVWNCDCYRAGDGVHSAWLERRASAAPAWKSWLRRWNPKHRQLLALERALFSPGGASVVIANSQLVRSEIAGHYPAYPARQIEVVYNGLPAGAFHAATPEERRSARAALGLPTEEFVVLFAGSGWERKGLRHALAAVARLPARIRPRLLVAGRGRPAPFLRAAPAAAARSRFLGPVRDMAACQAAADVFVLPTLYDPFSNACLEALAAGLPVLTTDANGFAEILTPGMDGDIVRTADHLLESELAARLSEWADPARLAAARPVCSARAAGLTIERNVALTLARLGIS